MTPDRKTEEAGRTTTKIEIPSLGIGCLMDVVAMAMALGLLFPGCRPGIQIQRDHAGNVVAVFVSMVP